jgi:hypothetical protein
VIKTFNTCAIDCKIALDLAIYGLRTPQKLANELPEEIWFARQANEIFVLSAIDIDPFDLPVSQLALLLSAIPDGRIVDWIRQDVRILFPAELPPVAIRV